jgi:hypothetical protein
MKNNSDEKRLKTSINLKRSLRNAAIKHLIDLTGSTEISEAVELALSQWIAAKSTHDGKSSGYRRTGTTERRSSQIVTDSQKMGEPTHPTQVSENELASIEQLLRVMRSGDRRFELAIKYILEAFGA